MIITTFKYKNKLTWCIVVSTCDKRIDLETDIKKYLQSNYVPENVFLLRPESTVEYPIAKDRIPNFTGIHIKELVYDSRGKIKLRLNNEVIDSNLNSEILNAVYNVIFKKHDTTIKASHQSYFNLPSGNLATHFIRVANVFTDSEEINILSIFLLSYFDNLPDIIYCDTPSIFPIVYSCILIKNAGGVNYNPKVKSYSSYTVSRDDIENTGNSLFVISTSISGSLPARLNQIGIDWSKIVVLFSFDTNKKQKYKEVSKLLSSELLGSDFYSLKPTDFKQKFADRTFEVKFEDGQFIPSSPLVNLMLINKADADSGLSKFMENYKDYDFIKCYSGKNSRNKLRDLYFDVSKLFRSLSEKTPNHFEAKTNKLLINLLPINLISIIFIDHEESEYLANQIKKYYEQEHKRTIKLIFYKDLKLAKPLMKPSSYLVCSSCISDGKKVSNVSRILRSQENSQIIYFNGFLRCRDEEAFKNIKGAIQYGKYGFSTYNFITIDKIFLPNEDSDTVSWESEKIFINGLIGINNYKVDSIMNVGTKKYFESRLNCLNSNEGLTNNVFLPKKNGKPLILNKNFAFFEFSNWEPKDIQQSKVYFTILSVIHRIRINRNISQTAFERFLLSPENFNRYNDGIIQSALLRSANKNELNYQIDSAASRQMSSIILGAIEETDNVDSAPYEFLMAICINKLTLCKVDLDNIYKKHTNHSDNIIKTLIKVIYRKFLNN